MDFFADGGFQQLFCDLNDQQTFVIWNKPVDANYSTTENNFESHYHTTQDIRQFQEENCLYYEQDYNETQIMEQHNHHVTEINDKQLQASLDYLLTASHESTEDCEMLTRLTPMPFLSPELSDWEEKFLDNYIEIPELVDILPEKTPLCTDTCNHFLQESAENLKLYPSPPSSPECGSLFPAGSCSNAKENDKSYPCNFGDCRKVYAKPAHLKAHLRRHLGEKPYVCNWPNCTWRFSRSDELSRHRRSHSGVKPYECNFCAKCFARSDHLTKHRKVHERRLQAAQKAGKAVNGVLPACVLTVRPGRKRKNQL